MRENEAEGAVEIASGIATLGAFEGRVGRILLAAATPMLPEIPQVPRPQRTGVEHDLKVFLTKQVFAMPRYLLWAYLLALFVFEYMPILRKRSTFSMLILGDRVQIIGAWSQSAVAKKRDLLKLIRNSALFFYLDHPIVRRQLMCESQSSEGKS